MHTVRTKIIQLGQGRDQTLFASMKYQPFNCLTQKRILTRTAGGSGSAFETAQPPLVRPPPTSPIPYRRSLSAHPYLLTAPLQPPCQFNGTYYLGVGGMDCVGLIRRIGRIDAEVGRLSPSTGSVEYHKPSVNLVIFKM